MFTGGAVIAALAVVAVWAKIRRQRRLTAGLQALRGKVVLITGASSGLGEACARAFYMAGCKLVLCARRSAELKRVKAELEKLTVQSPTFEVRIVTFDLSDRPGIAEAMRKVRDCHGPVDIVINNAGMSSRGLAVDTSLDVDVTIMNVNYFGQIAVTKALLPDMIRRKSGHIVVISSIQGKLAIPFRSTYAASKHALQAFFDSLRAEVTDHGIHVSVISPGYIRTNLSQSSLSADGTTYGLAEKEIEAGMSPEYVADCIVEAVCARDSEVLIGPLLYLVTVYLRNFLPNVYFSVMRRRAWRESMIHSKTS